jgi:O-antigen ligase
MRGVALATAVCCCIALVGADTRTPYVDAVAGAGIVLVLLLANQRFSAHRIAAVAVAAIVLAGAGVALNGTKSDSSSRSSARFQNLFHPLEDESMKVRLDKWEALLDEVHGEPFGRGLGTALPAAYVYARFDSVELLDPDSGYIKVAYELGLPAMILYIASLLALIGTLATGVYRAVDPWAATTALAACGALAAMAVALTTGAVQAAPQLSLVWVWVGVALAPLIHGQWRSGSSTQLPTR